MKSDNPITKNQDNMKTKIVSILPAAALAMCGLFLLATHGMAEEKKTTLNSADERFVKNEVTAGKAVVKLAGLGAKKTERTDIRAFAEMLVTDHSKANEELTKLAETKGVELSAEADTKHEETYQKLENESGPNFDKAFLAEVVSGHKKCVSDFEKASQEAKDDDLKAWAEKMVPALKAHLEKAKELSTKSVTTADSK